MSNQSELDEILKKGYRYEGHEFVIDTPYLKQAIIDWHNKQTLKLLDRLSKRIDYNKHDLGELGEFIRTKYAHNFIEDERNRLKEPKV